ncbi:lysophospholipid acyltransferase family protein [Desulfococcus sp.]|uniref:lysophospholipid acyltransferase family protein n=1 Tax=Desulfococcus sp. TaxID=2025834 RepID=UPI00359401DD
MRKIRRILYQPYKWLILVPVFIVSTIFFGGLAVVLCTFLSPRIPSYLCGATWARLNGWLTPMFVRVTGREFIDRTRSYVIISNHQSQYDIFVLYGWLGIDFKWVMKIELRKLPFIGVSCERLGHIFIDRSDRNAAIRTINAAKEKIAGGTSVLFFPEGTRSRSGRPGAFKKGGFKMALDLGLPILPITIRGTRAILPPDTFDILPGRADLIFHPPIETSGYHDGNLKELIDRVHAIVNSPLASPIN